MSKPLRKDHKKTASKPTFNGWNTTDEDEIARRRLRASLDAMKIYPLEPDHPIYGTFSVRSLKARFENLSYSVEIRSLSEFRNSCTCPDYNVMGWVHASTSKLCWPMFEGTIQSLSRTTP